MKIGGDNVTDYIKREDAISTIVYCIEMAMNHGEGWMDAVEEIENLPSADVVPVVRCEDCKYWSELEHGTGTCKRLDNVLFWLGTDATDFCSFAERKDNEIG